VRYLNAFKRNMNIYHRNLNLLTAAVGIYIYILYGYRRHIKYSRKKTYRLNRMEINEQDCPK